MEYGNDEPLTNGSLRVGQGTWFKVIVLMEITDKFLKVIKIGDGNYSWLNKMEM